MEAKNSIKGKPEKSKIANLNVKTSNNRAKDDPRGENHQDKLSRLYYALGALFYFMKIFENSPDQLIGFILTAPNMALLIVVIFIIYLVIRKKVK